MNDGHRGTETTQEAIERLLRRALWGGAILLLLATAGFAGFYYQDRYLYRNDPLVERQIRHMEAVIRENPADVDARVTVAEWYLRNGMLEEAIAQGQEALKLDPNHTDAHILLARVYLQLGDTDQAIAHFAQVVQMSEGNEFAVIDRRMNVVYYNLGELYRQRGDYDKAIDALRGALRVDRTDADARYALGLTYQALGDHQAATREFNEALRFVPDFTEVYVGLKESYTALGLETEAAYAEAMIDYGQEDYAAAMEKLERIAQDGADFAPIYLGLALTYEKLGAIEAAIDAIHRYLETHPESVIARHTLGRLTAQLSRTGGR